MIIYTRTCLACTNKVLWKKVRNFAREHNLSVEVRRTNQSKYKEEAEQYGVDLPFAVNGNVALSLSEPLEGLL